MQFVPPPIPGTLLRRYKRFLADVQLDNGEIVTAHCANPGSMKSCAEPGWKVLVSPTDNPKRKLRWTWQVVYAGSPERPILVNTALPNHVVKEAVQQDRISELTGYSNLRTEVRYGENSRIDLLLEHPGRPPCYVEVKNVTMWESPDVAAFPDSVTARGTKHLTELAHVVERGDRAVQFFLVPRHDVSVVKPADDIDPKYGKTLRDAHDRGDEVIAYAAKVTPTTVLLSHPLPVDLSPASAQM